VVLYDLPVKIATAVLIYVFIFRHLRLNRPQAITLILLYFTYILARPQFFPADIRNGA
jgi:cation:H+ antiporter